MKVTVDVECTPQEARAVVDRTDGELRLVLGYVHADRPVAAEMIIPLV